MPMPGRNYTSTPSYRYGFNSGSEKDDEIYGIAGSLYTTEFRELDTRLGGRWWSPDPIVKPWESPYAGFSNNPIYFSDPMGLDPTDDKKPQGNTQNTTGTWETKNSDGSYTGQTANPVDLPAVETCGNCNEPAAATRAPVQNQSNTLKISYGANANRANVSQKTVNVLNGIAQEAGIKSLTITSTSRTPYDQARIMYGNVEKYGVAKQKKLYAAAGDQVIDTYSNAKLKKMTANEIIAIMEAKIIAIGPGKISKHTADPNVLNVVDISAGSISNPKAFINAVNNSNDVSKFLQPPTDPAYHLEIPQR
jgi:hypothetical protein